MPKPVIEVLQLPFDDVGTLGRRACVPARNQLGTFPECPWCGGALLPEHAHYRCRGCGWRDSCCD